MSEVLRWESPSVDDQIEPDVRKCALQGDRQAGSASTSSASGKPSSRDLRARMLPGQRGWLQQWGAGGSAKLAGCEFFLLRHSPVATSPSPSVKRSPCSAPRPAGSGRSLARLAVPRRRSRGSCAGTRPPVVACSTIEPRPRSGMRTAEPSARKTPSSQRTHGSASTSRNASAACSWQLTALLLRVPPCSGRDGAMGVARIGDGPTRGAPNRSPTAFASNTLMMGRCGSHTRRSTRRCSCRAGGLCGVN